ncbi:hypothetical protein Pcinc_013165 [Petrolisthes cinctipes]|uniref:Uncharacterized protein n=1 Tax=Petrolisthes cinctipes TaxID=88211 RepID=A0AAE1KSJ3_PETCI|nr:hypothetical protein Pcinc_013165 [Petrolisthes cinctipes]
MEQLKRLRASAKRKFTRKHNIFTESLGDDDPLVVLQGNFDQCDSAFTEVEKIHEEYIGVLSETGADESVMENEDSYIFDIERKKNNAHKQLEKKKEVDSKILDCKTKVKVKALDPPMFDGNLRDYPSFKADFERLIQNSFGKDPYALKQCLTGDALKTVKGVENDYELMIKRLDDKYGNSRKVVDMVLCDLKALKKIPEGDSKEFLKAVDKIETCWLDLKKMNLTAEMNTSNMVSHIEKILPSTQKREWVIVAENIANSDQIFPELLKFLLREKRVLEYMDSGIRRTGTSEPKGTVHSVSANQRITTEGVVDFTISHCTRLIKKAYSFTAQAM